MIPFRYNARNLLVRWKTTALTSIGFTLVVVLLVVMLAFVEGLKDIAKNSGHPGNIMILKDGATDELFSDIDVQAVHLSLQGLWSSNDQVVRIGERPLVSYEVYAITTQELPPARPGDRPTYRFIQLRGIEEPDIAGQLHLQSLQAGGRWYGRTGTECVMGAGIAKTLGLTVGDTFQPRAGLPPMWTVVGIMNTAGSPFDSEIWAKREEVGKYFGKDNEEKKQSFYTTIVLRTADQDQAVAHAKRLRELSSIKLNALPEREYYAKLGESIQAFQFSALFIAIVMAIGGCLGLMNTMFATVAQRVKDIGVLRILGYAKWQILVCFLIESLLIAAVGGVLGIALGSSFDGLQQTGQLSNSQGGNKTVVFKMKVNESVIQTATGFIVMMGLLGGLLPAFTAMRQKPLDAVR